jgi:hypothetical protein
MLPFLCSMLLELQAYQLQALLWWRVGSPHEARPVGFLYISGESPDLGDSDLTGNLPYLHMSSFPRTIDPPVSFHQPFRSPTNPDIDAAPLP